MAQHILHSMICAFVVLLLTAAESVQAADTAILPATAPDEPDLLGEGGLLDSLYGLENLKRIPDDVDQIWVNLGRARATARAAFTNIFRGPMSSGEFRSLGVVDTEGVFRQFLFEFDAGIDSQARGDLPDKSIVPVFRWAIASTASPPDLPDWSSRTGDNRDGSDHMVTWLITGGAGKGNYVVAWEDFEDNDFQDLVVEVSNVLVLEVVSEVPPSLIRVTTTTADVSLSDGACSIIEAVNEANDPGSSSDTGDCDIGSQGLNVVELQEESIYNLNKPISSDGGNIGLPSITGNVFIDGKRSTVRKYDKGSPLFRIFHVADQGNLTILELTIAQGESEFSEFRSDGAGILNRGKLTLISTILRDNFATDGNGGGISNLGSATLIGSTVSNNFAAENAGGILNLGHMEIIETAVINNQTDVNRTIGVEFDGGGILNSGILGLINSTVANNRAGIYGGGIANRGTLTLVNSSVAGNDAGFTPAGRGMSPSGGGGGISGGAVVSNSIIAGNSNTGGIPILLENCDGSLTSLGHNLDDDGGCGLSASTDLPNTDPRFDSFIDSGQPGNAYLMLLADSPAIDTALDAACPSGDQRRRLRPSDGNGDGSAHCDIGSIEYFPVINALVSEDRSSRRWYFSQLSVPGGPEGTLKIRAVFTNGDTPIRNPYFQVIQLSTENIGQEEQNVLLNADDGPGRLGSILSIDVGDDMVLKSKETFSVEFIVGLHTRERFKFFVNLRGEPSE